MGTPAVGGVTGWVAVSQELLGLCVIRLPAVLASLRPSASSLPPASAPVQGEEEKTNKVSPCSSLSDYVTVGLTKMCAS